MLPSFRFTSLEILIRYVYMAPVHICITDVEFVTQAANAGVLITGIAYTLQTDWLAEL